MYTKYHVVCYTYLKSAAAAALDALPRALDTLLYSVYASVSRSVFIECMSCHYYFVIVVDYNFFNIKKKFYIKIRTEI